MRSTHLVLWVVFAGGCMPFLPGTGSSRAFQAASPPPNDSCALTATHQNRNGWRVILSNGGSYQIALRPVPVEIPVNAPFALEVRVWDVIKAMHRGEEDVRLLVDATMPAHGHGMTLQPQVTGFRDCAFIVEGLLLHMKGSWQLVVDVDSEGIIERTQIDLELD